MLCWNLSQLWNCSWLPFGCQCITLTIVDIMYVDVNWDKLASLGMRLAVTMSWWMQSSIHKVRVPEAGNTWAWFCHTSKLHLQECACRLLHSGRRNWAVLNKSCVMFNHLGKVYNTTWIHHRDCHHVLTQIQKYCFQIHLIVGCHCNTGYCLDSSQESYTVVIAVVHW